MTPPTSNTELDKAIERCEVSFSPGDIPILLLAAKRLKEVEKERDELRDNPYNLALTKQLVANYRVKQELSTLRTDYKQALGVLEASKRCLISITLPDWQNDRDRILSTPSAIAAMKGEV